MKFNDVDGNKWEELKPYLDTCLLPLTGLTGFESPHIATTRLEELRDVLECLEKPYHGRMVTYPALHYTTTNDAIIMVNELVGKLKEGGFKYVVVVTIQTEFSEWILDHSDLYLCIDPEWLKDKPQETREMMNKKVSQMWRPMT